MLVLRHRGLAEALASVLGSLRGEGSDAKEMGKILHAPGNAACARITFPKAPEVACQEAIRNSSADLLAVSVAEL